MKKISLVLFILIGIVIFIGCESKKINNSSASVAPQNQAIKTKPESEKKDNELSLKTDKFTKEDLNVFKVIKKYYPDFNYSDKYIILQTNDDSKKMLFSKQGDMYFDTYVSYDSTYHPYENLINYSFDAGTASRGYGSYYVIDDNTVINIEKLFGTSSYVYQISKNGITIDGNNTGIDETKKYPIDIEYDKAMQNWSGVTLEGVDIICTYGDKWKNEMEKYYNLLYKKLNKDKKKWLISSQEKWETFTKENEELAWQIYDQNYHGGSIMQIFSAEIYYDKYRERALDLMKKYETFEEGLR